MISKIPEKSVSLETRPSKRQYKTPVLEVFGKITALTQGGTCIAPNDSGTSTCGTGAANMKGIPLASAREVKENIRRIGDHPLGFGLYLYNYKTAFSAEWGRGRQFGVLADEVEAVAPDAVCVHSDGYKMVDYSMLGITRFVH